MPQIPKNFQYSQADIQIFRSTYEQSIENILRLSDYGYDDYTIDPNGLALALSQIEEDLNILSYRRLNASSGISDGKVAGIYIFRLIKTPILHLCHQRFEKTDYKISALSAMLTAFKTINKHQEIETSFIKELFRLTQFRHMNQETLAIAIDTYLKYKIPS